MVIQATSVFSLPGTFLKVCQKKCHNIELSSLIEGVNRSDTYEELPREGLMVSDLIDIAVTSKLVKDTSIARGR